MEAPRVYSCGDAMESKGGDGEEEEGGDAAAALPHAVAPVERQAFIISPTLQGDSEDLADRRT